VLEFVIFPYKEAWIFKPFFDYWPNVLRAASKPAKNGGDTIGHVMINANPCAIADL
jgi:hypothetical protein